TSTIFIGDVLVTDEQTEPLHGVCSLYFETGTEGSFWAFQDEKFITTRPSGRCEKCGASLGNHPQLNLFPDNDQQVAQCPLNEHKEGTDPDWSYEGLHILKNRDILIIYDKDCGTEIVWTGIIDLKQYPIFTESVNGVWIHSDQVGPDRETWARWFQEEYPAQLIVAPKE
ncbi:hypothetical protein OAD26_00140, partial [bacterium]|nr:hypothetical protein [bacterium]